MFKTGYGQRENLFESEGKKQKDKARYIVPDVMKKRKSRSEDM